MPYNLTKNTDGSYRVQSPSGTRAKKTTKGKAMKQIALLRALESGKKK